MVEKFPRNRASTFAVPRFPIKSQITFGGMPWMTARLLKSASLVAMTGDNDKPVISRIAPDRIIVRAIETKLLGTTGVGIEIRQRTHQLR